MLSSDVGAIAHESIALTPAGLVFASHKGKYLLDRGWAVQYIGAPVATYDSEDALAVHVMESQHQIRWLTSNRVLVFDYLVDQWAEWTIADGVHAAVHDGTYHYATTSGVNAERSDFTGIDYGLDIETAWIPLTQIQGFGRVWRLLLLGEIRGDFQLRVRLARNFATSYFQDKTWAANTDTAGEPLQMEHRPSVQEMEALRVRLTVLPVDGGETDLYSEAVKLTNLALEVGLERGLNRMPVAQRQ
jgi:hypothetical protein